MDLDQIDLDQVQLDHKEAATTEACRVLSSKVVGVVARRATQGSNAESSRRSRRQMVAKFLADMKVPMRKR